MQRWLPQILCKCRYVLCNSCKSPDTLLDRDSATRIMFLRCQQVRVSFHPGWLICSPAASKKTGVHIRSPLSTLWISFESCFQQLHVLTIWSEGKLCSQARAAALAWLHPFLNSGCSCLAQFMWEREPATVGADAGPFPFSVGVTKHVSHARFTLQDSPAGVPRASAVDTARPKAMLGGALSP